MLYLTAFVKLKNDFWSKEWEEIIMITIFLEVIFISCSIEQVVVSHKPMNNVKIYNALWDNK